MRREPGDDRGRHESENEGHETQGLSEDRSQDQVPAVGGARQITRPIAEECAEGNRICEHHERRADECRPELGSAPAEARAGEMRVECGIKGIKADGRHRLPRN
jgi:hypothetical protein